MFLLSIYSVYHEAQETNTNVTLLAASFTERCGFLYLDWRSNNLFYHLKKEPAAMSKAMDRLVIIGTVIVNIGAIAAILFTAWAAFHPEFFKAGI